MQQQQQQQMPMQQMPRQDVGMQMGMHSLAAPIDGTMSMPQAHEVLF